MTVKTSRSAVTSSYFKIYDLGHGEGVLNTTLCDNVCQWFSLDTPVSTTNKTNHHDTTEILLKVTLNTITLPLDNFAKPDIISGSACFYIFLIAKMWNIKVELSTINIYPI